MKDGGFLATDNQRATSCLHFQNDGNAAIWEVHISSQLEVSEIRNNWAVTQFVAPFLLKDVQGFKLHLRISHIFLESKYFSVNLLLKPRRGHLKL